MRRRARMQRAALPLPWHTACGGTATRDRARTALKRVSGRRAGGPGDGVLAPAVAARRRVGTVGAI